MPGFLKICKKYETGSDNARNSLISTEGYYKKSVFLNGVHSEKDFSEEWGLNTKKGLLARIRNSGYRAARRMYVEKVRNDIHCAI